ncbi:MAG: hypothetical protein ACD_24C00334G0004 [uncultured bacterium]|nr:MAG: hypothetical protein ACD_24C00334G0004 [uncultured bacterium]
MRNLISKMNIAYLDANFLIDWLIRKNPNLKKRARILLAKLLAQFDVLAISPLAVDESWRVIQKEIFPSKSYADGMLSSEVEIFTEHILNYSKIKVVQFQNPENGIKDALYRLKTFSLQPRDSFHLAIMRDNNITVMVSRDDGLVKRQSLLGISIFS